MDINIMVAIMKKILIILLFITNSVFSQNAHIILESNSYFIMNSGVSLTIDAPNTDVFTLGSNTRVLSEEQNNKVYWKATNGNYKVPFTDINANSVAINYNVSTPGSGNGFISFSTGPTDASQKMVSTGAYPNPVLHVNSIFDTDNSSYMANRFWFVGYSNYTTNPIGIITLNYTDNDISGLNESTLQSQYWDNSLNDWIRPPIGNCDISNNVVNSIQSNNNATVWCVVDKNYPLPIELLSFTVSCEHHTVLLQWSTSTEINNSHFLLQRSNDAINFQTFAIVNGSGNSNQVLNYSYTDDDTYSYYRLVQVDYDNTATIFDGVATNCDNTLIGIQPNPFSDKTTLSVSSDLIGTDLYIHDVTGILIEKKTIKENKTIIEIETAGIYIISFQVGDKLLTKKIVKI